MEVKTEYFFECLESLEATWSQSGRDISAEALGRSKGGVRDCFLSLLIGIWCFSNVTSLELAATQFENVPKPECIFLLLCS